MIGEMRAAVDARVRAMARARQISLKRLHHLGQLLLLLLLLLISGIELGGSRFKMNELIRETQVSKLDHGKIKSVGSERSRFLSLISSSDRGGVNELASLVLSHATSVSSFKSKEEDSPSAHERIS